nr:hypothetical protein BaRGS_035270 [Batillaria attramentaria]
MFGGTIQSMGSSRLADIVTENQNFQEFVLSTPDFEATKIWVGNLGKIATHAVVYAQLYTPDGVCHGLHTFVVPIRDTRSLMTLPGVMVGDMGEKLGLNGIDNGELCLDAYKWLVCRLLVDSDQRVKSQLASGKDGFTARNDSQTYFCRSLALAYIEHEVLRRFIATLTEKNGEETPGDLQPVLRGMCALYGLWSLEKHLATLYQGGYISGSDPPRIIREAILRLCSELKDDAVALVDVLAPPDFILNSPIGASNGEIYKNLYGAMLQGENVLERPSYWRDFVNTPVKGSLPSKL